MMVDKNFTDEELLHSLKTNAGLDAAVGFMYKNWYGLLESIVVTNNGNTADAEDIVQEAILAFIEIVRKDKFRGESSVKSFLYSIAKNLWMSELRKRNSADRRNRIFEEEKENKENSPVRFLMYREAQKTILNLFSKLGDKCKEILLLAYYENLSMKEIAERVEGYSNEQVLRNKKYKCMKQLEEMMEADSNLKNEMKKNLQYGAGF